ncbi:MAG TPA: hypothetical protein VN700_06055 [Vicinamibacterales bacterium]|nr:hypothetical protein [Vicinamibacterales bacterium]
MSRRAIAVLWLVLGVAIWNGFNDIYVSRGAHEFAKMRLEYELGRGPEPDMVAVTQRAKRQGRFAGGIWASIVIAAGWGTILLSSKFKGRRSKHGAHGESRG